MSKTSRCNTILVKVSPLDRCRAHVRFGPLHFHGALGRGGAHVFKREGDGVTPIATMAVLNGFQDGRDRQAIRLKIRLKRTTRQDGWCDAPGHGAYNRPVRLPFPASHEELQRADCLYDYALVLDWNITTRRRWRGSAIFFHVAKPGYPPTQGCIAISRRDMARLLPHIDRSTRVVVRSG